MLYNHINDVKDKLRSRSGLGVLPCASFMLIAIEQMKIFCIYIMKTALSDCL